VDVTPGERAHDAHRHAEIGKGLLHSIQLLCSGSRSVCLDCP
jgi:hypothetical protein